MNPVLPRRGLTNVPGFKVRKNVGSKTYVPNLSASRRVNEPEVKAKAVKENKAPNPVERCKAFRETKLLPGIETFTSVSVASSSRVTLKNAPKITSSISNSHLEVGKSSLDDEDQHCQDLPVSIPRPRLSFNYSTESKPILIDFSGPKDDESVLFILKTPKYFPRVSTSPVNVKSQASSLENEMHKCTIQDLPDGQIGTLQIMKSNRYRLVLGECTFWLHRGVHVAFKEELAFVNVEAENKTGRIVNLGDIKGRLIAVPECTTAFAKPMLTSS